MYFYSSALTAISLALSLLIRTPASHYSASYLIELAINFLTLRLAAGCFVPFMLGLIRKLRYDTLLISASILWVISIFVFAATQSFMLLADIFSHIHVTFAIGIASVIGFAYVLAQQEAKPVIETDSLHFFPFINDWINGKRSTIEANYGYSSIWESYIAAGFLLQKTEIRSQGHLIVAQMQPIILMCLVLSSLIFKLTSSQTLVDLAIIHFISLYILWCWPSGIRSFKNDNLYNAGISLFLYALLSVPLSDGFIGPYLELSIGAIFGSVKYSGFLVLPATAVSALVLINFNFGTEFLGKMLLFISTAGLTSLIPAFVFPLRNLRKYGNALYPVRVKFRGRRLPGSYDPEQTSLLHAIRMPALWKQFSSRHYMERHLAWPLGLLLLVQIPLMPIIFVVVSFLPANNADLYYYFVIELCVISTIIIVLAWFITVWSASKSQNDLYYMWRLMQVRYVTVVPLLATVVLVGLPRAILGDQNIFIENAVITILLADTVLRLYATIDMPLMKAVILSLAAASCALLIFAVLKLLPTPISTIEIIASMTLLGAIIVQVFDKLFDSAYQGDADRYKVKYLQENIDRFSSANVFVATEIWRHGCWRHNGRADYIAIGQRLQHKISSGTINDFVGKDVTSADIDAVLFFYWDDPLNKTDEEFLSRLGRSLGFRDILTSSGGMCWMSRDIARGTKTEHADSSRNSEALERFDLPLHLSLTVGGQLYRQIKVIPSPDSLSISIDVSSHTTELTLSPEGNLDAFLAALRIAPRFDPASFEETGWTVVADPAMSMTAGSNAVAVVAEGGCRWGALAFYVSGLGRRRPISLFAKVRSRGNAEVVASWWDGPAPGRSEPLYKSTVYGYLREWTWICLSASFSGNSSMERFGLGCHQCGPAEGFEIEFIEILDGRISILNVSCGEER